MVAIPAMMVSLALPIGLAVALAFRSKWMWAAAIIAVFAIPHQLMGLTSTCTQGADSTFTTGAILSAPLLIIAVCVTLWALYRGKVDPNAGWVTLAIPLILLILTQDAWMNTLRYGTPCGEDFAYYAGSSLAMIQLILAGYLVLPLLLAISAAGSLMMAQPKRGRKRT